MASQTNFYSILGLEFSATSEEITRAYRTLALRVHPDRNREEGATAAFQKLQDAYETMKDPARRAIYDRVHRIARETSVFTSSATTPGRSRWNSRDSQNLYKTGAPYDPGYQFRSYPKQNPGPEYDETYAAEFKEQMQREREEAAELERERLEKEDKFRREHQASRFERHKAQFEEEKRREEQKREENVRREAEIVEEDWEEKVEEFRRNMRTRHENEDWDGDGEQGQDGR